MAGTTLAENLAAVQSRIDAALHRGGRSPGGVTLVAVTKNVAAGRIKEAYDAGIRDFGENYLQEAAVKQQDPRLPQGEIRWHFIGHLQKNKVRAAVERFDLIHSCDSVELAKEIGKRAVQAGSVARILLQVRLDPNENRFGLELASTAEAVEVVRSIPGVALEGLMGMAPFEDSAESSRPYFRALSAAFRAMPEDSRRILSMGMSGDFEVAIEEGATLVRIGTALFGARQAA